MVGAIPGAEDSGRSGHQKPCEEGMAGGLRLKKQRGEYGGLRDAANFEMMEVIKNWNECILLIKHMLIQGILLLQLRDLKLLRCF